MEQLVEGLLQCLVVEFNEKGGDFKITLSDSLLYHIYITLISTFSAIMIIPIYSISRIYQVICRHKLLTQQFKNYPMIFALFIVATIFTLCQTVRCIGNILDGYVFWKYKCFENVEDDHNSRIWGMPLWNYILKVIMRVMLIMNR